MIRIFSLLFISGCAAEPPQVGWSLVGLYDASALRALGASTAAHRSWSPSPGMIGSCGPVKAPQGLGITEAEAIEGGLTPALVVLLRQRSPGPDEELGPGNLRVSLRTSEDPGTAQWRRMEEGGYGFQLQPMVMPRAMEVEVLGGDSAAAERGAALVRTQLRAELCLEHKTGRAWIGGTNAQIREAYLLDRPRDGDVKLPDEQRFFGGQGAPVPAYLGPPDACWSGDAASGVGSGGKGQGSLSLTPTDVWDADLRGCELVSGPPGDPIALSLGVGQGGLLQRTGTRVMQVKISGSDDRSARAELWLDGDRVAEDALYTTNSGGVAEHALWDTLAHVPLYYPTLELVEEGARYTVLIVPNWQITAGLRALSAKGISDTIQDGVGVVLRHPEYLLVQVASDEGAGASGAAAWYSLTDNVVGESPGWRSWGYVAGHLFSREPIVLPGPVAPSWAQSREAVRATPQALALLCGAFAFVLIGRGLRRFPDLWTPTPEERITWWPGQGRAPTPKKAEDAQ